MRLITSVGEGFDHSAFARRHLSRFRNSILGKAIMLVAMAGVFLGCIFSFRSLGISWSDFKPGPLALLALLLAPVGTIYAGANLLVMGWVAKVNLPPLQALKMAAWAQLAEVLPLPGGAIVRGAALTRSGASKTLSAAIVLSSALLWIGCSAIAAGLVMLDATPSSWALLSFGTVSCLATLAWLARLSGFGIAIMMFALRVLGLLVMSVRLIAAFATIGFTLSFTSTFPFVFAAIAGSAASITPSGLGIGEGLAALFAQVTNISPAAGFLAVAINRFIGIAVNAVTVATIAILPARAAAASQSGKVSDAQPRNSFER